MARTGRPLQEPLPKPAQACLWESVPAAGPVFSRAQEAVRGTELARLRPAEPRARLRHPARGELERRMQRAISFRLSLCHWQCEEAEDCSFGKDVSAKLRCRSLCRVSIATTGQEKRRLRRICLTEVPSCCSLLREDMRWFGPSKARLRRKADTSRAPAAMGWQAGRQNRKMA